jgi:hypothetical protein
MGSCFFGTNDNHIAFWTWLRHDLFHYNVREVSRKQTSCKKMAHQHLMRFQLENILTNSVDDGLDVDLIMAWSPRHVTIRFGHWERDNFSTPPNNSSRPRNSYQGLLNDFQPSAWNMSRRTSSKNEHLCGEWRGAYRQPVTSLHRRVCGRSEYGCARNTFQIEDAMCVFVCVFVCRVRFSACTRLSWLRLMCW